MNRSAMTAVLALSILPALSGCLPTGKAGRVSTAKSVLLGLSEEDVRMCAGFPDRSFEDEATTIWSYELRNQSGGINLSAPVWAANTNLSISGGGSCQAQFRFTDGILDRLAYAGDNDGPQGHDTLCAPLIDGCLSYLAEDRTKP